MARKTALEKHDMGGQGPPPPTIIEHRVSQEPVERGGGSRGEGGTVVLIVGTLFLGYLYFTGRLQGVVKAIQTPGNLGGISGTSSGTGSLGIPPLNPTQNPYSTVPIAPAGYPRKFMLTFPAQYRASPVDISALDPESCRREVYSVTLFATGSPILAATYAAQYC